MKKVLTMFLLLLMPLASTACIAIGRSSRGGWFVWPGGLTLIVLVIIAFLLLRRR